MSSSPPRVTICVPTIGRLHFLPRIIAALGAQTRGDFEVLVLDNASDAAAAERIARWAQDDGRVRVARVEPRVPMLANFNRGVTGARGDITAFCHDDDVLRPTFVQEHVAWYDAHPRTGLVGSNYDFVDSAGNVGGRSRVVRQDGEWEGRDYIARLMRSEYNPLTMQSISYRTEALQAVGFDETLSPHFGDFVVLMRIAERWNVGHLAGSLVGVGQHEGQTSAGMSVLDGVELRGRLLGAYCDEYEGRWPEDRARVAAMRAGLHAALRRTLLRGWLEAASASEAAACLGALGSTALARGARAVLGRAEQVGVTPHRRRWLIGALRGARREFGELRG